MDFKIGDRVRPNPSDRWLWTTVQINSWRGTIADGLRSNEWVPVHWDHHPGDHIELQDVDSLLPITGLEIMLGLLP